MDDTQDNHGGRWLTYAELATIRGIGRASAVKLVQRERWRRSSGNDRSRIVRVLVPDDWLTPAKEKPAVSAEFPAISGEDTGKHPTLLAGALAALEDAVSALREQLAAAQRQLERSEAGRERAEADRADERLRADELRARIEALNTEMDAVRAGLEAERDAARREAGEAREAANRLLAKSDQRMAMGRWARAWAAWRGR
jgi:hypothetical protein